MSKSKSNILRSAEKLIQKGNEIEVLSEAYDSDKFAIDIRQNLYITKKKDEADFIVGISSSAETKVTKVKELKDPSNTHKYSFNSVIAAVNELLKKKNVRLNYRSGFNTYVLGLVTNFYDVKANPDFAYEHVIGKQSHYTYSQKFVDFIVEEIRKNPDGFVESLKEAK